MTPQIFVFGSNLAGRHGKGAALFAREQRGAIYRCGVGPQGNAYAIPTKDHALKTLPLASIARTAAEQHRNVVMVLMLSMRIRSPLSVSFTAADAKPPAQWIDPHSFGTPA